MILVQARLPQTIRDQAIVLGSKLLPDGNGLETTRKDIHQFIKLHGFNIKLRGHAMNSIMMMVEINLANHIKAYNSGYASGKQDTIDAGAYIDEDTSARPKRTTKTKAEIIQELVDIQIDSFMGSTRDEQEAWFRLGMRPYDDYDDDMLIQEYNECVDECNQIDEICEEK